MTKPVTRKMAVDCLLYKVFVQFGSYLKDAEGEDLKPGDPVQFDHIHADVFGGAHHYENLRPMQASSHKKKTKRDVQAKAKIDRLTGVTGQNRPKRKWASRPMQSGKTNWPRRKMQSRPFQPKER